MFRVRTIYISFGGLEKIKGCYAGKVADLKRKRREMGEGAAVSRQERVE